MLAAWGLSQRTPMVNRGFTYSGPVAYEVLKCEQWHCMWHLLLNLMYMTVDDVVNQCAMLAKPTYKAPFIISRHTLTTDISCALVF